MVVYQDSTYIIIIFNHVYIHLYIYICIPRTQMIFILSPTYIMYVYIYINIHGTYLSSVLEVEPFKTRSFPVETRVNWVPGIWYTYLEPRWSNILIQPQNLKVNLPQKRGQLDSNHTVYHRYMHLHTWMVDILLLVRGGKSYQHRLMDPTKVSRYQNPSEDPYQLQVGAYNSIYRGHNPIYPICKAICGGYNFICN